jgi:hypothetical protein
MKNFIYLLVISLFIGLSACEDILDKKPLDIISDEDVWNDETLTTAYLAECYATTYVFQNVNKDNVWNNLWWGDGGPAPMFINELSDESKAVWFPFAYGYKFGGLNINGGLFEWWEDAYNVIRSLNIMIQKIPDTQFSEEFKKQYLAEARFLRAFNYFEMVKRYGGVPLIVSPQNIDTPEEELYRKRNKEQDIYDFILNELDEIEDDLSVEDIGRATKYAALALKNRAALYAGSIAKYGGVQLDGVVGIPATEASRYFQLAYDAAKDVMGGGFALYNQNPDKAANFRALFMDGDNEEKIFVRRHGSDNSMGGEAVGTGWAYDFFQTPAPNGWGAGNQNGAYLEMAEEFEYVDGSSGKLDRALIQQGVWSMEDLWKNKDPRFYATLYTQGTLWKGSLLQLYYGVQTPDGNIIENGSYMGVLAKGNAYWNPGLTGFGVLKYLDENYNASAGALNGTWAQTETDWIVFRYAEILLNYAEAAYELDKPNDALGAINQVRERAGISQLTSVDMDAIRHERKVELAFEGHRYWDVRRWRNATTVLSVNGSGLRYIYDYETGNYKLLVINDIDGTVQPPAFYERNYYLPITIRRTGSNPNLVENPGY